MVEPWTGGLSVDDGVGAGECTAWVGEGIAAGDVLVQVDLDAASSEVAAEVRERLGGDLDGLSPPVATYSEREGAIWGDELNPDGSSTWGAVSSIFVGDTMVTLLVAHGAVGRDRVADHLALTEQIAATYGLDAGDGS